jgi:hypothetical protein
MAAMLEWDGGSAVMQPLGGMIAPLRLRLADGRMVEPLAIAPWAGEALTAAAPAILRGLRGDFPCVPFGTGDPGPLAPAWAGVPHAVEGPPHGEAANGLWQVEADGGVLRGRFAYPEASPVAELEQVLRPAGPGRVEITLRLRVRRDCRLPIALHPIFRLSAEPLGTRIELGAHGPIRVHPTLAGGDPCPLVPDGVAERLDGLPGRDGGAWDYERLPMSEAVESRLLVTEASGAVALHHEPEGWSVRLSWDRAILPSLMLWVSNRGRRQPPWSGRHVALGLEPCAAAFDLGTAASTGANPLAAAGVATAVELRAGEPLELRHEIAVAG